MDTPDSTTLKRCTKCGEWKPRDQFHRHKSARDGIKTYCKACVASAGKAYRTTNRDKIANSKSVWYAANKEYKAAYDKAYRATNHERIAANCKAWYEANKAEKAAYDKVWRKNWYAANKEHVAEYGKAWREENHERISKNGKAWRIANKEHLAELGKAYRAANKERRATMYKEWCAANPDKVRAASHRWRARKLGAGGSYTSADIEAIRKAQGNRCYLCGKTLKKYHVDHFIPLSKGGTNDPGNLRLACPKCNQSKNAKHPFELGRLL